jgi:hypothetical protein
MKNSKAIIISVVITLLVSALVGSIVYNTVVMSVLNISDAESFRKAIVCQELVDSLQQLQDTEANTGSSAEVEVPDTNTQQPTEDSEIELPEADVEDPVKYEVIYEDTYIKVTYVKQELSIFGPAIKFLIESKTTQTIDISFTNVHIDGYMADLCGVFVSELAEGKKSFETLYIYESDYENYTSFPSMVEFTIKVQDSSSWADLAKSNPIYINIQQ